MSHRSQLLNIVKSSRIRLSDLKPSEWTEAHRVMAEGLTPRPGPFSYEDTPYLIEVIDCLSQYHDAVVIVVMKGAQIGFSTGVIESGIGWIISENPGPILFMTGHAELTEIAMNKKIDQMIDSCGLRPLIRPGVIKRKNQRTGDTAKGKEFPGGSLTAGTASNHKMLRQVSARYGFLDDFEAVKGSSDQSGDTKMLYKKRFAAYRHNKKEFYISTPELEQTSNIKPAFLQGDQRYWNVPCPCCGMPIVLKWTIELKHPKVKGQMGGITWKLDDQGRVVPESVGYICQECGGFFDDSHKKEMNAAGEWVPTVEPKIPGTYSYHISSLYAPLYHDTWYDYVLEYLEANPPGAKRIERLHQVFVNTVLGETYEFFGVAPEANSVQRNVQNYKIGSIPEWKSTKQGNGSIVMLTCACDLNGTEKDARLDYEVVAWSETSSSYSILHGSIGTFIPREGTVKEKQDRIHWTYEHKKDYSVWPELEKILNTIFETDTGRKMKIMLTGVDTGHYTQHAYKFIQKTNCKWVIGIKGDKEGKYRKYGIDQPLFKQSKERVDLWLLDVNHIKDEVADLMELRWDSKGSLAQPPGFMNYPSPSGELYQYNTFFSHYESEHRTDDYKDDELIGQRWVKKGSGQQNHFWDIYVYNYVLKDIWAAKVLKESPMKKGNWADFVKWVLKK